MFQTPSKRGGTVLVWARRKRLAGDSGFKPLQNGAVLRSCWDWLLLSYLPFGFKPLQNGAVLRRFRSMPWCVFTGDVSNPFKTGRYGAGAVQGRAHRLGDDVSNPFKTGRYCVEISGESAKITAIRVSNPFKTGRYCVAEVHSTGTNCGAGFKPLQNGAVLRSRDMVAEYRVQHG